MSRHERCTASETMTDRLRQRVERHGDQVAFVYSLDGEEEHARLTYGQLDVRARAIAASLQKQGAAGERVLVLCPSGLDFIAAMFGCFYAGTVAIPVHPPVHSRLISRVASIVADSQASFVLTTAGVQCELKPVVDDLPEGPSRQWCAVDTGTPAMAADWIAPVVQPTSTALVQYTSGSTGIPKGVELEHRNLVANLDDISEVLGRGDDVKVVSWLPLHHDMGLIWAVFGVVNSGGTGFLMPPSAFSQRPMRWLETISRYGANISVAPNSGYELCVARSTPEERNALNLSKWTGAYCGAEPVRVATMQRFADAFGLAGFRQGSFHPVYGLTEATLFVSGTTDRSAAAMVRHLDSVALRENSVIEIAADHPVATAVVGCGSAAESQQVAIVDPTTHRQCESDGVGEIWVSGMNVAHGYWRKPVETAETFDAHVSDTGEGPFLRTGDLGFVIDGELFVAGRLKDLVIIRGRNYYPDDIEFTAQETHPGLMSGRGAVFAVTPSAGGGPKQVVVVQEVDRAQITAENADAVIGAIRTAITAKHQIHSDAVLLVEPLRIPTTSSGKIKRRACREKFLDGQLEPLAEWQAASREPKPAAEQSQDVPGPARRSAEEISAWFVKQLCAQLDLSASEIDTGQPLAFHGLDSLRSIQLITALEAWLGRKTSPTITFDFPTIGLLAAHLAGENEDGTYDAAAFETVLCHDVDAVTPPDGELALLSLPERADKSAAAHPLSFGQRSLWFMYNMATGSPAYTITYAAKIAGELDVPALEHAVQALVDRNATLRTTYAVRGGQPVQLVHPHWLVRMARYDIGPDESELDDWLRRESKRPVDIEIGPVFRPTLLARAPQDHVLVFVMHHIAVDFWSIDVMLDELRLLYAAERGAEEPEPNPVRYVDHVEHQLRSLESVEGERLWEYWREQLAGDLPVTQLPTDRPRRVAQTYRGAIHHLALPDELEEGLKKTSRAAGSTLYVTLLAAYATLLHRYNGQDELLIGSPFACRDRSGRKDLVGYLANPVVLRADMRGDPTFTALLGRLNETVIGAQRHQDFPFSQLVERLRPVRDRSHSPLFQVSFAWEQFRRFSEGLGGAAPGQALDMTTVHFAQGGAPDDLLMLAGAMNGKLICALQYNTDLFDASTIERMAEHFTTMLGGIIADPDTTLPELPILTEAEHREQSTWNATEVRFDGPECLHELIAETTRRTPSAVAVSYGDRELTYAELDRRAETLARRLRGMGVGPDTIVPILVDRSEDLVVGLLASLKAGGAFMPIDPAQPANRIAVILSNAPDAPVCVTHERHLGFLDGFAGQSLCLDRPSTSSADAVAGPAGTTADSLAYVIHTSGSTGVPKGALNTHGGIRNRLLWMQQADPLTADDRVLQQTPVTFDVSVLEIFWPLIAGARLVIAKPDGHKDVKYLVRTIADEGVTAAFFVPTMLRSLLTEPDVTDCVALRRVSCGGELVPYELTQRFHAKLAAELWNEYGPAEAAVTATYYHCKRGASGPTVPIGRPIANVRIHLLDTHGTPVPVGVSGELFIAGAGVGRGYLNRPDAMAESFVPDPFADEPGQNMYRTGDLARYLPDGNIEYLGRKDDQVKVRGVRIELGEVEAALVKHPAILENAVVAGKDGRGNTRLVAHIVTAGDDVPTTSDLRRFLVDQLPAAMVPAVFTVTESVPRTPGGKVDRRALVAVAEAAPVEEQEFVAARTPAEKLLAKIWCDVLEVDRVGVHDDFFALGGCSTHSMEVTVKAEAAGMPLTPEAVFVCSTIAELAAEYGRSANDDVNSAEPEPVPSVADVEQAPDVEVELATPAAALAVPVVRQQTRNTVIESVGTYLPAEVMSTDDVLAGCDVEIAIPLERLTGIKSRRVAGRSEFSIDLARQAMDDCLARSSHDAADIDLVIACNISRCDGPGHKFMFEPGTAVRLRDQVGLSNAIAFDISNACAGMWTGVNVADAFLKTGLVQRALVVSGEYITHLTDTAQKEIEGPMDSRLACLTLGDAGAAVILERGANDRVGFHDIDMATLGAYSKLCVAKTTDGPHGGAVMFTDSVAGTAVAVKAAVPYVSNVMRRHGWRPQSADHIIIHQTSESSLNDAMVGINRVFGKSAAHPGNTIFNLAERGNTASTSHWVALKDHILSNRIQSGDRTVFGISGSGQTVGAALYTFDDLPDRLRRGSNGKRPKDLSVSRRPAELPEPPRVRISGVGAVSAEESAAQGSVQNAVQAAKACLADSGLEATALGLLIHAGVYRDEFISEPAIAAFVAGDIGANDDIHGADGTKTLAFDVLNGGVGFLNACHVATQMIGSGKVEHAMVVASEIENNAGRDEADGGQLLLGVRETGSAAILSDSDGTVGFGRFVFHHDPEHVDALSTYTRHDGTRTWLQIDRDPKVTAHYLDCVPAAVDELLELEGLSRKDIAVVIPPFLPTADRAELAKRIDIDGSRFVEFGGDVEDATDPFTSSVPLGLRHVWQNDMAKPGDVGLIITVGSGLQVGCTTYRF